MDHATAHFVVPNQRKIFYAFSTVVLSVAVSFMCLVLFWSLYPYKVVEVTEPIVVLNDHRLIAAGEFIELELTVTKYSDVSPVRFEFLLCDGGAITIFEPGPARNLPAGKYVLINNTRVLPSEIAPGTSCTYNFNYDYKVNPVRTISKAWKSDPFIVVDRSKPND